jgi:hypothetical protein
MRKNVRIGIVAQPAPRYKGKMQEYQLRPKGLRDMMKMAKNAL